MKTLPVLLLVGFLALWTEVPSTTCFRIPLVVSGFCPSNPFQCSMPRIDRCSTDYDCPRNQKCCTFNCGRTCRAPQPVIPRICSRNPFQCNAPGIHRCRSDYECPGRQRCCYENCSRVCKLL